MKATATSISTTFWKTGVTCCQRPPKGTWELVASGSLRRWLLGFVRFWMYYQAKNFNDEYYDYYHSYGTRGVVPKVIQHTPGLHLVSTAYYRRSYIGTEDQWPQTTAGGPSEPMNETSGLCMHIYGGVFLGNHAIIVYMLEERGCHISSTPRLGETSTPNGREASPFMSRVTTPKNSQSRCDFKLLVVLLRIAQHKKQKSAVGANCRSYIIRLAWGAPRSERPMHGSLLCSWMWRYVAPIHQIPQT